MRDFCKGALPVIGAALFPIPERAPTGKDDV